MPTLDHAQPGDRLRIDQIGGPPELIQRLMEFGLFEGETITVIAFAPLGDPMELAIGDTRLSLRKREASAIVVTTLSQSSS